MFRYSFDIWYYNLLLFRDQIHTTCVSFLLLSSVVHGRLETRFHDYVLVLKRFSTQVPRMVRLLRSKRFNPVTILRLY